VFLSDAHHLPRAPLPAQGVTFYGVGSMHDIRERYLSFTAHTGSCARPKPSRRLGLNLVRQVFVDFASLYLGDGLSRHYLCNPCVGAWTPTPQCPSSALARFFPEGNGLTSNVKGSAHRNAPCNAISTGSCFSRLQSFRYVQAPTLARPPYCTHR
jgi:hypothetical protein